MKKGILVILVSFFLIASCSKGGSDDGGGGGTGGGGGSTVNCTGVASSFAANVSTIIQTSCAIDATCHGAGSANGPGPLLNYTQISSAAVTIKNAVASGTMPKTGTLTTAQKNTIICWVNNGALNN
ncbi:MAG TPA: hypothetical protein VIU35_15235 [Chitinophagaceae bacterium]